MSGSGLIGAYLGCWGEPAKKVGCFRTTCVLRILGCGDFVGKERERKIRRGEEFFIQIRFRQRDDRSPAVRTRMCSKSTTLTLTWRRKAFRSPPLFSYHMSRMIVIW
jgi:hypothetical protein